MHLCYNKYIDIEMSMRVTLPVSEQHEQSSGSVAKTKVMQKTNDQSTQSVLNTSESGNGLGAVGVRSGNVMKQRLGSLR